MPGICPLSTPVALTKSSLNAPCTHLFVSCEKQQQPSRDSNVGGADPTRWKDSALVKPPPPIFANLIADQQLPMLCCSLGKALEHH